MINSADKPSESPRDVIVATARRLFLSSGFRRVTMDDVAQAAGISKKTLYQHFDSKDLLIRAVLRAKFAEVERDLEKVLSANDQPMPQQLKALLTSLQGHVAEINPLFVADVRRADPTLFAMIDEKRQHLIRRYFGALLEKGQAEGAVRQDVSSTVLVDILIASAQAVVTPAKLAAHDLSPQQAFSQVLAVFFDGILVKEPGSSR